MNLLPCPGSLGTQFGNHMDYSPPGSSVHEISQARILEWVAISFSKDPPNPGIEPTSPALAGGFFTTKALRKPYRKNKASFIVTAGM